jgi:hypothetical protein
MAGLVLEHRVHQKRARRRSAKDHLAAAFEAEGNLSKVAMQKDLAAVRGADSELPANAIVGEIRSPEYQRWRAIDDDILILANV